MFTGPSKSIRPSESSLKRKYANLLLDEDDDESNDEDVDLEEEEEEEDAVVDQGNGQRSSKDKQSGLNLSLGQTSFLEPTVLFEANEPKGEAELSEHSGEDGISDHSISSSWGHNMDFPAMQMPEMFGFMRNRLKQKMMTVCIGASYVSLECAGFLAGMGNDVTVMVRSILLRGFDQDIAEKIGSYMEKHGTNFIRKAVPTKVIQRSQNAFQDKLLTELVGMERNLEKLAKIQAQNEQILKQYAKKSTQHVEQHLSRVKELHAGFLEKSACLGENVVESLQHVVNKEMKNMLKKMMQDMQQEQMKKTMQSLFLMR
eukprot:XP_011667095.1 PREDICTED: uncharacterized protein LOC105439615 [Strongylocentrotus purpuratus]